MMEYDFRTTLMILSAIAIVAILVHGLWKIRKNKNPYKLKAKVTDENMNEELERNFDGSGFDQDGVSQPRVIRNDGNGQLNTVNATDTAEINSRKEPSFMAETAHDIDSVDSFEQKTMTTEIVEPENKPVYETPISSPKPQVEINANKSATSVNKPTEPTIQKKVDIEPEVLVLSVLMPENHLMSGSALLPSLLTLGMKFGEMNIFHRHEDNAGNGKVTFSLANMMNPGTFDLDTMENFSTQGVSLFMTLPTPADGFTVFEHMLLAAKQLAHEFNAQLLDDKRNVMTKQTEQHYISRIRDFERKYRVAAS